MRIIYLLVISVVLVSCSEKFDSGLDTTSVIVIEGVIIDSDTMPSYVKVSRSSMDFNDLFSSEVKDALVIVSDDNGQIDTLQFKAAFSNSGKYYTKSFKAKSNNTYHLYVKVDGEEYMATTFMPPTVEIDSIYIPSNPENLINNKDNVKLFFNDPAENNYYLFQFNQCCAMNWELFDVSAYYVVNDKFLEPNFAINGYNFESSLSVYSNYYNYIDTNGISRLSFAVSTLTKESYEYLHATSLQINNDNGVYSPTPSSPKGNISNGALGYFRASSLSFISSLD